MQHFNVLSGQDFRIIEAAWKRQLTDPRMNEERRQISNYKIRFGADHGEYKVEFIPIKFGAKLALGADGEFGLERTYIVSSDGRILKSIVPQ